MLPIYLDYNATTPIDPAVIRAMMPFIYEHFGNPSSGHFYGAAARKAVDEARASVAGMLGCEPEEVFFTSGGSESNNLALKGVAGAAGSRGNHIVTSAVEHPSIIEVCRHLEARGFEVTYVPVDQTGRVNPADIDSAVNSRTILISVMHANNEVGTLQPLRAISEVAHARGVPFHTDAAQSIGKVPTNVRDLGVDLLSIAGHKLYAPKGIGALYVRAGLKLERQIDGASQERGLRAGTENVIYQVALGRACEIVKQEVEIFGKRLRATRDRLEEGLLKNFPGLRVNGHPIERLPNTSSVSFPGVRSDSILSLLDGVAVSAGSACHSGHVDISPVLKAMGVPSEIAMGTLRISTGRETTKDDIDIAVDQIVGAVEKAQRSNQDGRSY